MKGLRDIGYPPVGEPVFISGGDEHQRFIAFLVSEEEKSKGLESQMSSVMGVEKCSTVMVDGKKRVNVTYNINTVKGKELEEIVSEADSNYEVINDRINSFYSKAKLPKS